MLLYKSTSKYYNIFSFNKNFKLYFVTFKNYINSYIVSIILFDKKDFIILKYASTTVFILIELHSVCCAHEVLVNLFCFCYIKY